MENQEQPKKSNKWLTILAILFVLAVIGRCMGDNEKSEDEEFIEQYNDFATGRY